MKNYLEKEVKKTRNQYALPPRGNAIPAGSLSDFLSDFLNTKLGMGRVSQVRSLTPNFRIVAFKMWATRVKVAKIANIILPKMGIPPYAISTKFGLGRESQVRTLLPNFTVVAYKIWAYSPKIAKIGIFWYKFARKGYTPLCEFYKIWLGEGSPRSAPSRQISSLWLLKCGFTAPKIVKNGNFWYTFAPKGKFWGSTEKVEYRCITTTRMQ